MHFFSPHVKYIMKFTRSSPPPPEEQEVLIIYTWGWEPQEVPIQYGGEVKCLGVHYDIDLSGVTQLALSLAELRHVVAIARKRRASPDMLRAVFQSSLLNKVAYRGVLSGWSLEDSLKMDSIIAAEYRRRTKDRSSAQTENIFQPPEVGGLGFRRLSSIIQTRKMAIYDRLQDSPASCRRAVESMVARAQLYAPASQQAGVAGVGLWTTSLLSYALEGGVVA